MALPGIVGSAITRPVDGEVVPPDVVLVGNGWWREEGRPELELLVWTSDRQGELGVGRVVSARLEPGTHLVTLLAGRGGRAGQDAVTVSVVS